MHPTNLSIDLYFLRKRKKTSISLLVLQNHVCTYLNCLFQVFPMFYKYTVISEHSEKVLSGIICNTSYVFFQKQIIPTPILTHNLEMMQYKSISPLFLYFYTFLLAGSYV